MMVFKTSDIRDDRTRTLALQIAHNGADTLSDVLMRAEAYRRFLVGDADEGAAHEPFAEPGAYEPSLMDIQGRQQGEYVRGFNKDDTGFSIATAGLPKNPPRIG